MALVLTLKACSVGLQCANAGGYLPVAEEDRSGDAVFTSKPGVALLSGRVARMCFGEGWDASGRWSFSVNSRRV
jgi:hypothetical protein